MNGTPLSPEITRLAAYQRCRERIQTAWPPFLERRTSRLQQQHRNAGKAAEKVAETILEDIFTLVLDYDLADLNYQVDYADLVLTKRGMKYVLIEVKRPGGLEPAHGGQSTGAGDGLCD